MTNNVLSFTPENTFTLEEYFNVYITANLVHFVNLDFMKQGD